MKREWTGAFGLLAILALAALLLQDGSLPHQHVSADPGLFNRDHDLTTLATVGAGILSDTPDTTPCVVLQVFATGVVTARPAWAPRRHADSRAPPHA